MKSNPSSQDNQDNQDKPGATPPGGQRDRPVQTGALSGGQPGEGVNTSSSPAGQSNVDASVGQGVAYGKPDREKR